MASTLMKSVSGIRAVGGDSLTPGLINAVARSHGLSLSSVLEANPEACRLLDRTEEEIRAAVQEMLKGWGIQPGNGRLVPAEHGLPLD